MKYKLIIFVYSLFYASSSFAISDFAVNALFGGLLYAVILGIGFGICYYIFTNIFGFFKKASDNKSINNLNLQKNINTKNQPYKNNQLNTETNTHKTLQNSNISIDYKEEEEIYAKVSHEFNNSKKEGLWTKVLVEVEGDETKAKFNYIKQRVEQLQSELIEQKVQKENIIIREKEEAVIFEKLDKPNLTTMSKLDYLIQFHKKYKIDNKELIPTKFIDFLITKYNPTIHKTDLFPELIKLAKTTKATNIESGKFIALEHIQNIYDKYRWD